MNGEERFAMVRGTSKLKTPKNQGKHSFRNFFVGNDRGQRLWRVKKRNLMTTIH